MQPQAGLRPDLPVEEPDVTGTTSMDLPPALKQLFEMPAAQGQMPQGGGLESSLGVSPSQVGAISPQLPSYQVGGMVGEGGQPVPPGQIPGVPNIPMGTSQGVGVGLPQDAMQEQVTPQMMEQNVNQFANQHPEQMEQIKQIMLQELQSGDLTPQELNQIVQMTTVAAQNPEMYPQLRQFAIQQGVATEQDLPQQYDPGLIYTLMVAARAAQEIAPDGAMPQAPMGGGPQGAPMGGGPIPSMATGGPVPGGSGSTKPVVIEAHTGEYVIPKNVVEMKGKEFFDNLVEKYKGGK